jgi:hypothetical protein
MKTLKKVFFVIFLMTIVGRLSAQTKHHEEMVVPLSEPGKPVTLEAHLLDGSIKVVGYDGKDVIVTVYMDSSKDEHDEDAESEGMKRINSGGGMDVRIDERDNTVHINTGNMNRKLVALLIKVPQNTARVNVGTVNNGDISVTNVSGKVEIGNVNGGITATGISGSVVANTVNGDVIVKFKTVDEKTAMAFASLNGKIDVTLPADTKANLKLKSDNGEMFSDFDIAVDKVTPKIETNNEEHYHQIKIEDWVIGKLNGGGPEIMMKTTFGSIYIRKAK